MKRVLYQRTYLTKDNRMIPEAVIFDAYIEYSRYHLIPYESYGKFLTDLIKEKVITEYKIKD